MTCCVLCAVCCCFVWLYVCLWCVDSSLFNTTPSLAATIMNHFKMGSNTLSYNISGMGCSAGEQWVQQQQR